MLGTQTWIASASARLLSRVAVATVLKHVAQMESQLPSAFFLCGNRFENTNAIHPSLLTSNSGEH
jgi:hypothetical protein